MDFRIEDTTNRDLIEKYKYGINDLKYIEKMEFLYDKNVIAIPEKTYLDILINEILNPFNLFQVSFVFSKKII